MKKKIIALITILVITVAVVSFVGCSKTSSTNTSKSTDTPKQEKYEYTLNIQSGGKMVKSYKIEDIKKMSTKSIEVDGKTETGPALLTILNDCGISEFSKVTFKGIANDSLSLSKDKIDGDVLLDIANRGTVKLACKSVPKKDWIKDIVEINVEE